MDEFTELEYADEIDPEYAASMRAEQAAKQQAAPEFSKIISGNYCFGQNVVCTDGQIRWVTIEQYRDGFMAILTVDGQPMTDYRRYETSRKAVNAAARYVQSQV